MNIFYSPKFPDWESYFPAVDGVGIVSIPSKISAAAFSAFDSLKASFESICGQSIERISPPAENEPIKQNELLKLCTSALNQTTETEEILFKVRNLIKEGAEIHSSFKNFPLELAWLREHCAEELRERAAVITEGLELIDFETMLPPDWQPPAWLSSPKKIELSEEQMLRSTSLIKAHDADKQLQLSEEIGHDSITMASFCLSSIAFAYANYRMRLEDLITFIALAVLPLAIIYEMTAVNKITAPLNQNDMQRLHTKALQNPLYEALWKKVEDTSPTTLQFAPLSMFGSFKAHFSSTTNKINIYEGWPEQWAFEALIFESANAFQKDRFDEVNIKWTQGKLAREEYARLNEYVEWETLRIHHQIMDFGNEYLGWPAQPTDIPKSTSNFAKCWEQTNMRSSLDKADSHTDNLRKQWRQLSFLYYLRHPEHAPSDKDWINKVPGFHLNPLAWLAENPQYAVDWEIDPFIQLLDKGALVGEGLIDFIFLKIRQTTPEGAAINSTRIRKLLEHPERLPKPLTVEQMDLLKAFSERYDQQMDLLKALSEL